MTTPITTNDITRIAATGRTTGELLDAHGQTMLTLTHDWTTGPKAANTNPDTGGNHWETDEDGNVWPIPNDPTGEAVLNARADFHHELQRRLHRWHQDSLWLRDAAHVLAPIVPPSTMNTPSDLWCDRHLRIGLCEPRHRGTLCRYCSDFHALWRTVPPISILRDRHLGKRITENQVKTAISAEKLITDEVADVTKKIQRARRPNQNQRKRKTG